MIQTQQAAAHSRSELYKHTAGRSLSLKMKRWKNSRSDRRISARDCSHTPPFNFGDVLANFGRNLMLWVISAMSYCSKFENFPKFQSKNFQKFKNRPKFPEISCINKSTSINRTIDQEQNLKVISISFQETHNKQTFGLADKFVGLRKFSPILNFWEIYNHTMGPTLRWPCRDERGSGSLPPRQSLKQEIQ